MPLRFIQISGAPGSGKTTPARAIAPKIDAVIIDHDITKTALLDWDIPIDDAIDLQFSVAGYITGDTRVGADDSRCARGTFGRFGFGVTL